ncbi:MAG: hypothetical protein MN733_19155 [Nitrososphaera sp.]|nr:hypothetical protein [Nitrososphaera sp.]
MNNQTTFKRIVAVSAFVSVPLALSSWVLVALAAGSDPDALANLTDVITLGPRAAGYAHLAWMVADTFGHNLLLAPIILYLWIWLKPHSSNFVTLFTLSGFAYILVGLIGVSLLGGLVPPMMRDYAVASESQREEFVIVFRSVFNMLFYGTGPLAFLLAGIWWLGIGNVLRKEHFFPGAFTMIVGALSLIVWLEMNFRIEALTIFEVLQSFSSYIWLIWLGIVIWRNNERHLHVMEVATAD